LSGNNRSLSPAVIPDLNDEDRGVAVKYGKESDGVDRIMTVISGVEILRGEIEPEATPKTIVQECVIGPIIVVLKCGV
jgi:hypothetical protein